MKKYSQTERTLNRIMFVLAILGVCIAIYVTQSFLRQSSILCVSTGCEIVRKNASSYILGIPVPAFGLIGYAFLVILTFLRSMGEKREKKLLPFILGIAAFGVVFVSWFTYTELFVIHAICTWCAISAVNMTIIFFLAFKSYQLAKEE